MRRRRSTRASRRLGDERGFTLIELLVVMAAGMVVATALFTILDVTLRQTTRTFSRVDATQRARTVLERVENELHSACVANKVQPIIAGTKGTTNGTNVSFWSAYGSAVNPTPVKKVISFDSTAGKLIETTYPVESGIAPNWNPSGTASSTETLLTNVAQSGSVPVFQYYELREPPNTAALPANPLSAINAENTSQVRITLVVKPTGGSHQNVNLAANTVTNSALLRLTPPTNIDGTAQEYPPCV